MNGNLLDWTKLTLRKYSKDFTHRFLCTRGVFAKYECVEIGWNNGSRKPIGRVVVVRSLILWLFSRLGIIYTVQRRNKDNSDTKITQRLQVKHNLAAQVRFSVLWNYLSTIWTKTEQNTCYANLLVKFPLSPRPRSWTVFTWLWEPNRLHFKG